MKTNCYKVSVCIVLSILLAFSSMGFAADKKPYLTSPPAQAAKKWCIGYYEGGPYKTYPVTLIATVNSLEELGWIEPVTVPPQEDERDMSRLWAWLAANVKSKYLEFKADAYYSYNWNKELREQTKQMFIRRLKETADIDLIIAMGTWAGQDLANNDHSIPTLVCSTSDPIGSKIIKNEKDSGYDHVHAQIDPTRYLKQIRAFHDVFGFKKLGVAFQDTVSGRSYAAIEDIQKVAKERKFEIAECYTLSGAAIPETHASVIKCVQELAPEIDAFYLTQQTGVNKETLPQIVAVMNAHKIPTFSQAGPDEVRQGILLSVASPDFKVLGKFHAGTIAKIINGAKPRDLNQIFELTVKSAFNAATAKKIGLKPELYNLLLLSSVEVYKEAEADK
jgi:ABC-type uncharacterized transport system substrate-binding protein